MLNPIVKIGRIVVFSFRVAVFASSAVHAQPAPMDMSSAIRAQKNLYNQGQAAANAAAMQYLRYMLQLRRRTGVADRTGTGLRGSASACCIAAGSPIERSTGRCAA